MSNYSQFVMAASGFSGTSGYSGISGWSGADGGALTNTYIAYGSATDLITGSAQLTWNDTTRTLTVGSLTHGQSTTIIGKTQNTGVGTPGTLIISGANGNTIGGDLILKGGRANGSVPGGNLYVQAGNSLDEGEGGDNIGPTLYLRGGSGGGNVPAPGVIVFQTTNTGDVPQEYIERARMRGTGALSFGPSGTAYGSAGQVLTSNGDAPPSWQSVSGGGSGYSGYSGYSGVGGPGTSGYSGYSGVGGPGTSGYSGVGGSGASGYSGATGNTGTSGFSGWSGQPGGLSGYSGFGGSGVSGYSGVGGSGASGYSGFSGSGISGYSGVGGPGASGYSGWSGQAGGLSGYSGFSGGLGANTASYSVYFDGNGDMLTASSLTGPLTGDFTYEAWAYATSSTLTYRLIIGLDNYGSTTPFRLYQYGTNFQFWYTGGAGSFINSNTISLNQWYHLAITRSGTDIKFFVNGTQVGSTLTSSTNYPTSNFRIGMDSAGTFPFVGFISNVRVVNGTPVYTSNFTPPTSPLTAVGNTVLLTCQQDVFQGVTTSGNPTISESNPFGNTYGTSGYSGISGYSGVGLSGVSGFSGANNGLPALFAARAISTGQTFNGNATVDLVTLVFEDVSGMVNLSTNRLIVPSGCDRAILTITAKPTTAATSVEYYTALIKNGSATSIFSSNRATRTFNGMTESSGTLNVVAGDYFEYQINTASAGTTHTVEVSIVCWNSQAATVSGYSGRSGYSGISGYSGTGGISGYSGVTPDLSSYVTLTGTQTLTNKTVTGVKETKVAMAANDVDITAGNYFTKTITTTTTFTASNVPVSGTTASFVMELTNAGSQTINWFTGTTWASGSAPTLTVAGVDVLGFYTFDGGTTWRGLVLALDIK